MFSRLGLLFRIQYIERKMRNAAGRYYIRSAFFSIFLAQGSILVFYIIPRQIRKFKGYLEYRKEDVVLKKIYKSIKAKIKNGDYEEALAETEYLHTSSTWERDFASFMPTCPLCRPPNTWDYRRVGLIYTIENAIKKRDTINSKCSGE